jgi:Protein of unknown function (DUF4236)
MGLWLFRPEGILPGVTLNLSKSGPSLNSGERGTHVTVGASQGWSKRARVND